MKRPSGHYYYASGRRVALDLDPDWIAVDIARLEDSGESAASLADLARDALPLRGTLVLARRGAFAVDRLDALDRDGSAQPAFRSAGAMLLALPEVRVEESAAPRRSALHRWLAEHAEEVEVAQDRGDRLVLRPASGRGLDAIDLANRLAEQVGPEMAQPSFLRIVEPSATTT